MLYALCIVFILIISYYADRRESRFGLFLCALVLSLFCGFRGIGTGVDTIHYYNFTSYIRGSGIAFGSDIGFSIISYFLMGFFDNPYYPLVVYAFITNFLIVYRLWDFRDKASFVMMMCIYMVIHYPYAFNIVRQFLAISIVFWGTRYIERGENKKYILLNILASTIHTSSLLCFSFLFVKFSYQAENKRKRFLAISAAIFFVLAGIFLFSDNITKYEGYFELLNDSVHVMTMFKLICLLVIMGCNRVLYNKRFSVTKSGKYCPMQKYIPLIYALGLILSLLGMFFSFINRIGFYFIMFEMPFWGQTVRANRNKNIYRIIIFLILGYVLVTKAISGENPDNLFYYHSFLSEQ